MIYFASDLHLGARYISDPRAHEARIVAWLDSIKHDAQALYILGDVFDYWFEYKTVVPKGFVRFLAKIAELTESGVEVHFFTGNHDSWMFDYLPNEFGVIVHDRQIETTIGSHRFILGHGDDIGFDRWYHVMMWAFHNKFLQACYRWVHPDFAGWFADTWSYHSRMSHYKKMKNGTYTPRPLEKEYQVRYARQLVQQGSDFDFIVFGHRHKIFDVNVGSDSHPQRLLVIGDWINNFSYATYDGQNMKVHTFPPQGQE